MAQTKIDETVTRIIEGFIADGCFMKVSDAIAEIKAAVLAEAGQLNPTDKAMEYTPIPNRPEMRIGMSLSDMRIMERTAFSRGYNQAIKEITERLK